MGVGLSEPAACGLACWLAACCDSGGEGSVFARPTKKPIENTTPNTTIRIKTMLSNCLLPTTSSNSPSSFLGIM